MQTFSVESQIKRGDILSVLFSPVGESDPIRNCYDGPILHILRYYSDINKIYLFFSKAIERNKEIISKTIKNTIAREIEINFIFSEIEDAHNYNIFYSLFSEQIKKIRFEYENEKIYINISSGTPQMSIALALLSSQEKIGNFTTIQVSRPHENIKDGVRVGTEKYDIEEEMYFNYDNEININRCTEVQITAILSNNIKKKIETLINMYEYSTALELYNSSPLYNNEIHNLLMHLSNRISRNYDRAIQNSKNIKYKDKLYLDIIVNNNNNRITYLFETFLIINNLYETNKINDFLVRLCSYCEELQKESLAQIAGYNIIDKLCDSKQRLNRQKVELYSKDLMKKLDEYYGGNCEEKLLSINTINVILKYEIEKMQFSTNIDVSIFDKIEKLKKYRHIAAHTLVVITKSALNEECNINELLESIKSALIDISKNKKITKKYFNLYKDANKYIIKEMG